MPYGLLSTGFVPKTQTIIQAELETKMKAAFGENFDVAPESPEGQIIGMVSEGFAELWEGLEAVNASQDPDEAEGQALTAVCAITGTTPRGASSSLVQAIATGNPGTILATGRQASTTGSVKKFQSTAPATIAIATAWAISTAYVVGDLRRNGTRIYVCTFSGTSAASGGPTGTGTAIADNTVVWRYVGEGTGFVLVEMASVETGPILAAAFTLTTIETPFSGWLSVSNLEDAELGEDVETDPELRQRREDELVGDGSTAESVLALARKVVGVAEIAVYENDTEAVDADGVPAKSFETVVRGGADADIAAAIAKAKPAGIRAYGSTVVVVTDSQGIPKNIGFTRPTDVDIWVIANVKKNPKTFPADGATQVRDAIVAAGNIRGMGYDAVSAYLKSACFAITGVLDVSTLYVGTAPAPASEATVAIGTRQLADYDTSRTTVNVTDAVP